VRGFLTALILLVFVSQAAFAQGPRQIRTERVSGRTLPMATPAGVRTVPDEAVAGQVLVRLQPGTSTAALQGLLAATDTGIVRTYPDGQLFLLKLPAGQTVNEAVAALNVRPEVALASPDRLMYLLLTPNDPRYSEQWHWPLIHAPAAWDVQTGSAGVAVAVVDSGVDLDHPDLATRIWVNSDETAGDGIDNDGNGFVDDRFGWNFVEGNNNPSPTPNGVDDNSDGYVDLGASHGTHVAGIIGAATNNAEGVAGHDWQCRIMAIKVMNDEGGGVSSDAIAGVQYAAANGAKVINLSIGGFFDQQWTQVIADAVAAGVTVVAAAGNDSWTFTDNPDTWMSPVCNDGTNFRDNNVLGVGATDRYDRVAWFSNLDGSSRNFVDVMAPGLYVLSCLYYDPDHPELHFTSPYGQESGTSMACPVAAGLASLIAAQFPHFRPASIISQIRTGADNIDAENSAYVGKMGAGRVNSQNCLQDSPPALPRTVMAYDTPNDEGGSITVVWSLSADDGKGFNDVIGYRVQRSTSGEEGTFVTLASPAAGVAMYQDTSITENQNYVPFYYRIGVRDSATEVFTAATAPAYAKDDTPPPAIADGQFVGGDVQGDDGGAISLSWTAYSPPGDFGAYRVWRADAPFTSVGSLPQPLAVINDAATKTYVDRGQTAGFPVVDGKEYYYAVTVRDDKAEPNEITDVQSIGPVVASPNFTVVLPPGLSMISIPAVPHDNSMGAIFRIDDPADLALARWDPTAAGGGAYAIYSQTPNSPFLKQQLGRGFWYRNAVAKVLNISGMPPPYDEANPDNPANNVSVPFYAGWNQLGNPYGQAMPVTDTVIIAGGDEMNLQEANNAGYCRNYLWRYDAFTSSYKLVSPYMTFAEAAVPKNEGFYFLAFDQGTLRLPRPAVAVTSLRPAAAGNSVVDEKHWSVQLVARAGDAADTDNFIGVNPAAASLSGVLSPPLLDGAVDLAVAAADRNYAATSFVESVDGSQTWYVTVTTAEPGRAVTLSWPDLSQVPSAYRLLLKDTETGRTVNMRTATAYTCQLAEQQSVRKLQVVAAERDGSALAVTGLRATATGGGAGIYFTLSQDAGVDVEVLNICGRVVRRIAADRALSAGANVVLWDQRADNGTRVPRGRYLVCVVVRADDGSVAKAIGSLHVQP